jgi:hypothetical protein
MFHVKHGLAESERAPIDMQPSLDIHANAEKDFALRYPRIDTQTLLYYNLA